MSQESENSESQDAVKCLLCGGELEAGYVPDHNHYRVLQSAWVRGQPAAAFLGGLKAAIVEYPLEAFRCADCGYVMMFARVRVVK